MKNVKRERKYIGFILGMIAMLLLSFAVICVTAEPAQEAPTDPVSPTETAADTTPTQEIPQETEAPTEAVPTEEGPTATPTQQGTTPPVVTTPATTKPATTKPATTKPASAKPTATIPNPPTGSNSTAATVPPASPTQTALPTFVPTLTPTVAPTATNKKPPFTMGPINTDDLLPEYNPQITPGKSTETADPAAPAVDMHGYVLRIAATWDEYQDASLNTEAIAAFEAKYNCKVLFLDLSKEVLYNRLLMSAATGVTYFDAVLVEGTEILVNMEPFGLLQSFSQYMTEAELAALPVSYQKFLSKDGVLYGIPAKAPDVSGIWYNPALETQYQYTSPLNAYRSGNWDWNQLTSFFKEATRDLDNDGFYNTYGMATSSPWYLSVLETTGGSLFRWNGTQFLPGATNGVSVQGLTFVQNVYVNHYVASDYERYFYTGQAPYLAGELSMYPELISYLKGTLHFLPYPSVKGTGPYAAVATSVPSAAITATAIYPEQTAELLKILYGGDALNQRVEAYCTESGFTDEIKTMYLTMLEDFTVDYTNAFDVTGEIQLALVSVLKNSTVNAETLQKTVQPLLEQAIKQRSKQINLEEVPVEIRW